MARNNVGSGLGLAIVYNLIQMMNGTVTVKNEKEKGTELNVTIPLELVYDNKQKERERRSRELMWGIEVLVMDDDPIVGEQIAVEKYQSSPEGRYLAVPMDIRMPVMDGLEATGTIRSSGRKDSPEIPVIVMAANAFEGIVWGFLIIPIIYTKESIFYAGFRTSYIRIKLCRAGKRRKINHCLQAKPKFFTSYNWNYRLAFLTPFYHEWLTFTN